MGSKKLDYQGRAFSDADLQELPLKDVSYAYEEVNFSQNSLSAEGLRKILELCSRCDNLRILKLYKNDIGDESADALARFVRKCSTLDEIHLSHNHFTEEGVEKLVKASEETRENSRDGSRPMWLRLEQNEVNNPEKVLNALKDRYSVAFVKNRTHQQKCKVHLPHFFFQRNSDGQPNNDGPRKRNWESNHNDGWKDDRWQNRGGYRQDRGSNWEDEPPRKKWRADDGADWDRAMPASVEPERPRPGGAKMSGGIFMRAMGAIVTKKDGEEDDGEGRPAQAAESPERQSRAPKSLPNNVASRLLGGLGVLGGAPRRKSKVDLREAPKRSGIKKEPDDEEMDEEEDEADAEQEEEVEEEEVEEEPKKERSKRGRDREERPRRDERGGMRSDRMEEPPRRRASPPRCEQRERQPDRRRGGGRDDGRRSLVRRHQGNSGRHDESSRRHASDRRGDRTRRRDEGGRREEREASRERRRPQRQPSEDRRERRRRDGGGERAERPERGEERRRRKERGEERETERETERKERPRQRTAEKGDSARMAAADRTEMLLEKIQGSRRARKSQREASEQPMTKQEPVESRSKNPPPLVATRAKAAPRRTSTPAPATAAASAPRPKTRAASTTTTTAAASKPAAKAAAKAAAKEGGDGNESEYTYTDASEYTYEEVEEEAEEEVAEVEDEEDDDQEEEESDSDA